MDSLQPTKLRSLWHYRRISIRNLDCAGHHPPAAVSLDVSHASPLSASSNVKAVHQEDGTSNNTGDTPSAIDSHWTERSSLPQSGLCPSTQEQPPSSVAVSASAEVPCRCGYQIRDVTTHEVVYQSEWLTSRNPTWKCIPASVRHRYGHLQDLCVEIFCMPESDGPETYAGLPDHVVDMEPTRWLYAGRTPEASASAPSPAGVKDRMHVVLDCVDESVYVVPESLEEASNHRMPLEEDALRWTVSPGGCGQWWDGRSAGDGMTLAELHGLATSTLLWSSIHNEAESRLKAMHERIHHHVLHGVDAQTAHIATAQRLAQQVNEEEELQRLRDEIAQVTSEIEHIKADTLRLEAHTATMEAQLAPRRETSASPPSPLSSATAPTHLELLRARVSARISHCLQERTDELKSMFPVVLSSSYGSRLGSACSQLSKDTISGVGLPVFALRHDPTQASQWKASNRWIDFAAGTDPKFCATCAEEWREESVAMGNAATVIAALAIFLGYQLPFRLVLGGPRSYVAVPTNATSDQPPLPLMPHSRRVAVLDDGCRTTTAEVWMVPLFGTQDEDRPMLFVGLQLLRRNALALGEEMGRDRQMLQSCGLRIGALLLALLEG